MGRLIERDSSLDLTKLHHLSLLLNEASFTTVEEVAKVINRELAAPVAWWSTAGGWKSESRCRAMLIFPRCWRALRILRYGCGAKPR